LPPEQLREYPRIIHQSGRQLLDLVNDILDMSRLEAGRFEIDPQPLDVADLASSCFRAVTAEAEAAGVELRHDLPDIMPEIVADERGCRQMLLHLLSNAIKFSKPGGTVTLAVRFGED